MRSPGSRSRRDPAPRVGERELAADRPETDADITREARERFQRVIDWETSFRSSAIDDVRFVNGDADNHWQWPDNMYSERGDRPSLTINKTRQHCLQIINDAKQNAPQVRISPVSDEATKASAEIFEGICRHIEYVSNAATAYNTATEHQVHAGIGWWRIVREYEDEAGFEQGLRIVRVRDPMSIYMDPDIQELDGSDARWAFVVDDVPRDDFEQKYPEYADRVPQATWAGSSVGGGWLDEDHVRIAEYYRKVVEDDVLHMLPDGSTVRESELAAGATLSDLRAISVQSRAVERERLEWFKIVGDEIVDERQEPGRYIPLVRVIGEEAIIEGRLERKGHVRALKDPQRMYNYWSSSAVESVALQSKTPYIAAAESIEAFQQYWDTANSVNHSVLPFNARDDQGQPLPAPTRQEPPQMPQAYMAGMQQSSQELMMASGQYQPTLGQPSPQQETSGRAIQLRQRQGDNATYHYIDNLAVAIRFTGRILLDLIPLVYDTPRVMQIMAPDGTVDRVQLDPTQPQPLQTAQNPNPQQQLAGSATPTPQQQMATSVIRIFNPTVGRYEVQADVGPAYATKRQQAFDALLQITTTAPQLLNVAGDLLMKAADFPMADELAERLQRLVPPNVLGQGPSPQEQQLQQQLNGSQAHVALLAEKLAVAEMRLKVGAEKTDIESYRATTERMGKLLSMAGTDGAYVDGTEVRALIMQMVQDAMQQAGMAPVQQIALQDAIQRGQILQGLAPSTQAPPFAQAGSFGDNIPGMGNGQIAALSPLAAPRLPQGG
jgi:hypothetical protein